MDQLSKDRFFSVELKARSDIKNVTIDDASHEKVLIEGTIGNLLHAQFVDGAVLEVFGNKGILRISLTPDEIKAKQKPDQEV